MNTYDLENPFEEKLLDSTLEVEGRSVVLLRELTIQEAGLPEISDHEIQRILSAQTAPAPVEVADEQTAEPGPADEVREPVAETQPEDEETESVAAE